MNNKTKLIVGGIIIAGISFFGGVKYDQSTSASAGNRNSNFAMQGGEFRNGTSTGVRGGRVQGGSTAGSIVTKDATSITIATIGGGSKIIFFSPSTTIMKTTTGVLTDLMIGKEISVNGIPNPDGSINAESIQLRPNFATSTTR